MKSKPWNSLVLRMAAAISVIVLAGGAFVVTVTWFLERSTQQHQQTSTLDDARQLACHELDGLGQELYRRGDAGVAASLSNIDLMPSGGLYMFRDGAFHLGDDLPQPFQGEKPSPCADKLPAPLKAYLDTYFVFREGRMEKQGTFYLFEKMKGRLPLSHTTLTVAVPLRAEVPLDIVRNIIVIFALIIVAVCAVAMWFHNLYRKRVQRLNAVFDEFQAGNYASRPVDRSHDEIGVLARHIADKLNLIEHKVVGAERVGLQVAHELKRLLTRSVQQLWLAKSRASDTGTREDVGRAIAQIVHFGTVMKELLNLGLQAELVGGPKIEFGPVDLSKLVVKVVESAGEEIASKKLEIRASIAPGIRVFGSSPMLEVLFDNLVENAVKYACNANVALDLSASQEEFRFCLRNGLGKPDNGLPESYRIGRALIEIIANRHGFALVQPLVTSDEFEIVVTGPLYDTHASLEDPRAQTRGEARLRPM